MFTLWSKVTLLICLSGKLADANNETNTTEDSLHRNEHEEEPFNMKPWLIGVVVLSGILVAIIVGTLIQRHRRARRDRRGNFNELRKMHDVVIGSPES